MGQLDSTFGILFIGFTVSAVLFGVTNLQTYIYFQHYQRDTIWNKLSVCWLWFLDALHLAFCIHMVYYYLITQYMNPSSLMSIVWSFKAQMMLNAIVVVSVQSLYAIRIWKLNCLTSMETMRPLLWRILPLAIFGFVFIGLGAAILFCYEIARQDYFTNLLKQPWIIDFSLGTAAAVDFIISASMCYLLSRCRTGFRPMDSTITVLTLYVVNTGVITVVLSITCIIVFSALPDTFGVIFIEFIITKLYVNSFMAMFNARKRLRTPEPASEIVYFMGSNERQRMLARPSLEEERPARDPDAKSAPRPRPLPPVPGYGPAFSLALVSPTFQGSRRTPVSQIDADIESSLESAAAAEKREDRSAMESFSETVDDVPGAGRSIEMGLA